MTLGNYLRQTPKWTEVTVWDDIYDIEVYFDNMEDDIWSRAMMKFADKLEIIKFSGNGGVTVNMTEVIERNLNNPEFQDLFIDVSTDAIMCDMENILSGYVSEGWLVTFVNCLK